LLFNKRKFSKKIYTIFTKYSLIIRIIEKDTYYSIYLNIGMFNHLLWFLVETPEGECLVDVIDNNNQLPILAISTGKEFANAMVDEMLTTIFSELEFLIPVPC
jgi:hypothetical protein